MITDFFFSIPAYLLLGLINNTLPNGTGTPPDFVNGVHTIWSMMQAMSFIIPAETMLFCLAIAIPFHLALFGFWFVDWLLKKVSGIN